MDDSEFISILAEEAAGSAAGLPGMGLKSLFSQEGSQNISAHVYYDGEMIDLYEVARKYEAARNEVSEREQEMFEDFRSSLKNTLDHETPSYVDSKEIFNRFFDELESRAKENTNDPEEELMFMAEFISRFLHGSYEKKEEAVYPILSDIKWD